MKRTHPLLPLITVSLLCGLSAVHAESFVLRPGTDGEVVPQVTTPSLVPNADFTEGLKGWTKSMDQGVSATVEAARADDARCKNEPVLRVRKTGGFGAVRLVSDRIEVKPGTEYLLTGLYHTTEARFGTLAEWKLIEITDPSQPEAQDPMDAVITGPRESSLTGHSLVYNCRPDQWRRKTQMLRTGSKTRFVRLALIVEGPPATILFDNLYFNLPEADSRKLARPEPEAVPSREETERALAQRPDSRAEVKQENGGPRLYLDGRPRVPFVHLSDGVKPAHGYVREFAQSGVNLHMIALSNPALKHWTGPEQYDFKKIDEVIWNSVQRDPGGYFIIEIIVSAYPDWHKQFPDDVAMTADGKVATSRHDQFAPASYYSKVYREQVMRLLRAYVRHIKAQPYARAIVGFMLAGGEDGQFYYQVNGDRGTLQDGQSPGDLPLFRDWLRRRYAKVEDLRTSWNDPAVTFETARPKISNDEYRGDFLDPKTQRRESDVIRFLNEEVANLLVDGLTVCKQEIGKPVIGVAYYGRAMSSMTYPLFAENSVIFRSDAVDMIGAQPGYYGWREAGNEGMLNWVFDSARRHKKLPMLELDFRTTASEYKSLWHDFQMSRTWNVADFTAAMARDAGKVLSAGGGAWWMEMTGGWFHDPALMSAIQKVQTAGQIIAAEPNSWRKSEVVCVVDERSFHLTTEQINGESGLSYNSLAVQQRAFSRSGVSYDLCYIDDLVADGRDDYKVYVFLNLYTVTDSARQFIDTKLKRGGKVLAWQYAPGYVTADSLSIAAMQTLTGITFAAAPLNKPRGFASAFATPQGAEAQTLLDGLAQQKMGLGVDLLASRFAVEDAAAQPLSTYLCDGKVSAAVKKLDGFTSIYLGHPSGLTPQLVHNLALLGGVQPFLEAGDAALFHRDNFIVVHGIEGGRKTLRLPFKATVTEMLTNQVLARDTDTVPLDIKVSDTLWLHVQR